MQSKEGNFHIEYLDGFYAEELDDFYKFRWMQKKGKIKIKNFNGSKYIQFNCFSNFRDLTQVLEITYKNNSIFKGKLLPQWHTLTFELNFEKEEIELEFETNKIFPSIYYPSDERTLSVRISNIFLHNDEKKYFSVKNSYENSIKNIEEMLEGKTILSSFPQNLGIDLYEKCNIKPPCVYCLWDENKIMEGSAEDIKVNEETLISYGDFYFKTMKLINCSIGEPFISPSFEKIVNLIERDEKILEISTNGNSFSERILNIIKGKKLTIYVSLDASAEETYKKLRNNQFKKVYENLKKLKNCKENLWPKIYLVFMPMKVNLKDLEGFFVFGKEINADYIILRPLIYIKEKRKAIKRAGYEFLYNKEILSLNEHIKIWDEALNFSEKYQVPVINQLFFGREEEIVEDIEIPQEANLCNIPYPICKEPWENYYILRRGICPCCYGYSPIGKMDQYKDCWNSKEIVEIREYLKDGKLSPYCLKSSSCPIVMRFMEKKSKISKFFSKIFK